MSLPVMKFIANKWLRLIPVLLLVAVVVHLWTYEYVPDVNNVPSFASKYLPDHLPWAKPLFPQQNPIPIEDAVASSKLKEAYPGQLEDFPGLEDVTTGTHAGRPQHGSGSPQPIPVHPDSPAALAGGHIGQAPRINRNAHKLKSPDAFKEHFEAVLSLPKLSVADAKANCEWPAGVEPNFQHPASAPWVVNDLPESVIEPPRQAWQNVIRNELVPWEQSKGNFTGKGIVIVGGQMNTLTRIKFQLRLLKAYKSRLPVEIHYWDQEMNNTRLQELKDIYPYVQSYDLSNKTAGILETIGPFITGYHMKTNAVLNSRFEEVLLLDSDNIPMHDPAPLFQSKTYKEYGTVFWPDMSRTRAQNPMWAATNTLCRMDEYEMESGQMLVDKRRFFYHLQLSSFLMKEEFYRQYLLGDKDMFRFAWHALKTAFGRPGRWVATIGTRVPGEEPYFCGRSFAQHHPDAGNGAISFLHLNAMKLMAPESFNYYAKRGGVFEYYKGPPHPADWEEVVPAGLKNEETEFLGIKASKSSACLDFYEEKEVKTTSILPDFDKFFRELGGYDVLRDSVGT